MRQFFKIGKEMYQIGKIELLGGDNFLLSYFVPDGAGNEIRYYEGPVERFVFGDYEVVEGKVVKYFDL